MKSEVSAAPIAWLKGLVANASVEGSISEENQGLSVELAIDSNMVLTCLNTNESSSNSCSLDNPKACSQLLSKIDRCKSEFREQVAKKPYKEFEKPIYVNTTPYPALNATLTYWDREREILQTYIDTLIQVGKKVDNSQSQPLGEASRLLDKIAADFPACVYKLDEDDLSFLEQEGFGENFLCAESSCSNVETIFRSYGLTGTVCDKYIPSLIQLKKTATYKKVYAIYETDLGLKGLAPYANPKASDEFSSFTYIIAKGETVEIEAKQLKRDLLK